VSSSFTELVHHLGLVLRGDAGEELALGFGDAELVEGALDVLRYVLQLRSCFSVARR